MVGIFSRGYVISHIKSGNITSGFRTLRALTARKGAKKYLTVQPYVIKI